MRDDLPDKAKLLLGLITSCNSNGLRLPNEKLGRLLATSGKNISRLIGILEEKELITIKAGQSRWRKIYLRKNEEVKRTLLSQKSESMGGLLPHLGGYTSAKMRNRIKEIQNNTNTTFPFTLRSGENWYLPQEKFDQYKTTYPNFDIESEFRKAAQWLIDNPTKRKTARGMSKFLNGWLSITKSQKVGEHIPANTLTRGATDEEAAVYREEMKKGGHFDD